jgi:hypothetical protein
MLNAILNEKEIDILNRYIIMLCKYFLTLEKNFIDKKMRNTFKNLIIQISADLDVITLIYILSSKLFNQKNNGNDLLALIEEKLMSLKAQNKTSVDRYLDANIKDNSIIFSLMNIISNSIMQELIWEFLISVMERRLFLLNLAEAITCSIFLLENRLVDSYILKSLSLRIVQICTSKNVSLDVKAYQIIFDNLSLLKILLDFNKLSFDNHTETTIEDLFSNYLEINRLDYELKGAENDTDFNIINNNKPSNDNKKGKAKNALNNNSNKGEYNSSMQEQGENKDKVLMKFQYQNLENSFYSNTSIILSKRDYTSDEIEFIFCNFNNEIHDSHYFKRFNLKKNPHDLLLIIKLLAKNSNLVKTIQNEMLSKIVDKAIKCFFSLEFSLHNRLFFMLNVSLSKDCIVIMKSLIAEENSSSSNSNKKNILNKLIKISYKKLTKYYFEIREILFVDLKEVKKDLIDDLDQEEMKNYFTTIALQFFEMFSLEKQNEKYVYFKDLIIEDLKNLVSIEVYNKNDLKQFVTLMKKDNLICEDVKNNFIKTNNYYF